mmetsp:Transcript_91425/g.258222  ORF Transcript_91425/g.258222 Transcript_91425/m.258222 type:complete len:265 (+) Transcript_91425:937-1731(+)
MLSPLNSCKISSLKFCSKRSPAFILLSAAWYARRNLIWVSAVQFALVNGHPLIGVIGLPSRGCNCRGGSKKKPPLVFSTASLIFCTFSSSKAWAAEKFPSSSETIWCNVSSHFLRSFSEAILATSIARNDFACINNTSAVPCFSPFVTTACTPCPFICTPCLTFSRAIWIRALWIGGRNVASPSQVASTPWSMCFSISLRSLTLCSEDWVSPEGAGPVMSVRGDSDTTLIWSILCCGGSINRAALFHAGLAACAIARSTLDFTT